MGIRDKIIKVADEKFEKDIRAEIIVCLSLLQLRELLKETEKTDSKEYTDICELIQNNETEIIIDGIRCQKLYCEAENVYIT